ncbi:MAG: 23S rRNA (guanosine(2251)-2'-O)-methyltransferase RlmB [Dysgonamonadaceae bacterium]|jgi:23S rRNA (guanosine2251-2'-O)-methyltransferase|nr:23S rRNA (guanosine(2251)-2'-O)-methyltransferase RlmB [Dysgonamonadaceae bacterium]MDD3356422.1 23S rRNA (guanosine(2251)-2'-O)-methyltransferase RlmB [Dysgonamonadaceae bacterium]MDD3727854.1 23S rRNA (guanosine(2251)-2'-O)-methyltransferase RlmB [Dysgonamonadaceae bacterium]MDD4245908.1 23S rRNA (guanosine(2251)-2'-O)-methyltransferase RlmB [Dysgonamonadaceae bacterium]MDD4605526.1 23S rRNA (guanosine(2251)-2'-O)-methyltransferase RlmB [Dysgonamonadaceae bacterium]
MKEKEMIFGLRAVIEAVQAGKDIDRVLVKRELQGELFRELQEVLVLHEIPIQKVPIERIDRITRKNHQGVLAFISAVTYQKIEDIVPLLYETGKNPFIVILDGITDVRNFGAIARTCEVAGVDAIVIPARGSVRVNADAIKTSAGALHSIPVCRELNMKESIQFLRNSGIKVVAATEKAAENYTSSTYVDPIAILLGSEDVGINPEIMRICDDLVQIPVFGTIQSLNVSVAAGVMLYEVIRQRGAISN